ncbi:MAG TPA: site-specific integrase [Micavibrio sp.]|nr:site-specific integrase [Micavibrio sp.]HIL29894.1 site-specific integrase [Micavibrio sp.]
MKAVDHHLYLRGRYYYYRHALPRDLQEYLKTKEVVIALGTQDKAKARLYVAKLDIEIQDLINLAYEATDTFTLNKLIEEGIQGAKDNAELPKRKTLNLLSSSSPKLFSKIAEDYLKDCVTNDAKTIASKRLTYEMFEGIVGNLVFNEVTKTEARKFKAIMLKTPIMLHKRKGFTSYKELDWNNLPEGKTQSLVTVNNRLTSMVSLFNWAEENDLYTGRNPFSGLMVKNAKQQATKRHPFSNQELQTLFSCPIYTGCKGESRNERLETGHIVIKDYWYWIPLIGLYTGMRLNEICQLLVSDIQCEDGIWIINIDDSEDKKVKTISSRRKIPIHDSLMVSGFLEYVRGQKHKRLFPELPKRKNCGYSHEFTKRFSSTLTKLNLKRTGLCFHSFRHTFIDGMRNAGVEKAITMKLVGHHSSNDIHSGYGYGYNLETLKENINKLTFSL